MFQGSGPAAWRLAVTSDRFLEEGYARFDLLLEEDTIDEGFSALDRPPFVRLLTKDLLPLVGECPKNEVGSSSFPDLREKSTGMSDRIGAEVAVRSGFLK